MEFIGRCAKQRDRAHCMLDTICLITTTEGYSLPKEEPVSLQKMEPSSKLKDEPLTCVSHVTTGLWQSPMKT